MHLSQVYSFHEIQEHSEHSHVYTIDEDVYHALITAFRDRSPIHVDEAYAREAGFSGCVMHGAILNGFLSHFVGMHFPGRKSLILTVSLNYHNPTYLGDEIELTARVRQKVETGQVVVLDVKFVNRTADRVAASGKAHVSLRNG